MVKMLDCGLEVGEFELQSCHDDRFQINTLYKGMKQIIQRYETLNPHNSWLESITAVLLQGFIWP